MKKNIFATLVSKWFNTKVIAIVSSETFSSIVWLIGMFYCSCFAFLNFSVFKKKYIQITF